MSQPKHISEVMAKTCLAHNLAQRSSLARIEFDGACEPRNPGGVATAGYRILVDGETLFEAGEVCCEGPGATNNVAEYTALGRALRKFADTVDFAQRLGVVELTITGDSQLVVNQVNDAWKCNKPHLERLRNRCRELIDQIVAAGIEVELSWVPREENEAADRLSRQAYEQHTGRQFPMRMR